MELTSKAERFTRQVAYSVMSFASFIVDNTIELIIADKFSFVSSDLCSQVRYLVVELEKGDSEQMEVLTWATMPHSQYWPLDYTACTSGLCHLQSVERVW